MSKFHINWKGEPGICKAKSGNCPLGDAEDHFATKNEARDAYEAAHSSFAATVQNPRVSYPICDRCEDYTDGTDCPLGDDCPVAEDAADIEAENREAARLDAADQLPSSFLRDLDLATATNDALVARKTEIFKQDFSNMDDRDHLEVAAIVSEQERRRYAEQRTIAQAVEDREDKEGDVAEAAQRLEAESPRSRAKGPKGWQDCKVPSVSDSKLIVDPKENDPGGGYLGGSKFVGGKVLDKYLPAKEAAKNIRGDIREAVKAGELPADLDYSVRMNSSGNGIRIYIGSKVPGGKAGELSQDVQQDSRIRAVQTYLNAMGNQYATDDSNAMVDYFNSHNRTLIYFRDKWV